MPKAVGVLLSNSEKGAMAFKINGNSETVHVDVNIVHWGPRSIGRIVDEEASIQDPRRKLNETMAAQTSEDYQPPKKRQAVLAEERQAKFAAKKQKLDLEALCPDGSAQEQALWFIQQVLKNHDGSASMKVMFAVLAKT